jgi:hypoxanthine phosphoribosyltransferase
MSTIDVVSDLGVNAVINENIPAVLPNDIREVFAKATCLFSKTEVDTALDRMATEISYKLSHSNPIFLCVVVGGIVALGNLLPRLDFPLEVDYIHATRYRNTTRGHDIQWKAEPSIDLKGRTIVIVDDILDGGITLSEIVNYCKKKEAGEIHTAILVDKQNARIEGGYAKAGFTGLKVDNHYVFGYGMDYKGYLRNAPGVYVVAPEHE